MGRQTLAMTIACVALCLAVVLGVGVGSSAVANASEPPSISVVGNQLESGGVPVQLRGVNRSAYANCSSHAVYDAEFAGPLYGDPDDDFADDGPVNQWSVDVMKSWGINAVRVPINESCWLGEPTTADAGAGQPPEPSECETYAPNACESAADYRQEVENYVNLLGQSGLYVILDLQDTAPPGYAADQVDHFPDAANAPTFWQQAATAFGSDPGVLFDLTGEIGAGPYDGPCTNGAFSCTANNFSGNWSDESIWNCWLNGCQDVPSRYGSSSDVIRYDTVGVQTLINQIRGTDTTTPIIVGSPDFDLGLDEDDCGTGSQSCWSAFTPVDPASQMVIDAHLYDYDFGDPLPTDANGDADPDATDEQTRLGLADSYITNDIEPIAHTYPVMFGELGETDCEDAAAPFVNGILHDALADGISVFGWTWDTNTDEGNAVATGWRCPTGPDGEGGPVLITDYDGSPTPMGQAVETWLQAQDPGHPAPPPAPITMTTPPASTQPPPVSTPTPAPITSTQATTTTTTTTTTLAAPASKPRLRTAPHISATGTELRCTGAVFINAARPTVSYGWYSATTHRRIAGPERTDAIASAELRERAVYCTETVTVGAGSASASSRLLPVPGRVSSSAGGPVRLSVICPAGGRRTCGVSLALAASGNRRAALGSAQLVLKAGKRGTASVGLSSTGRKLLRREHRLSATLIVTETVAGVKQTVVTATLTLS